MINVCMRLAELDHPSVHPAIHFGNRSLSDYRLRLAAVLRFFKRTVIGVGAQSRQTALPHLQKGILKRFRNQTVPQRSFSFRRQARKVKMAGQRRKRFLFFRRQLRNGNIKGIGLIGIRHNAISAVRKQSSPRRTPDIYVFAEDVQFFRQHGFPENVAGSDKIGIMTTGKHSLFFVRTNRIGAERSGV